MAKPYVFLTIIVYVDIKVILGSSIANLKCPWLYGFASTESAVATDYYSPDGKECKKCSVKCPYGQGLVKKCSRFEDIKCKPCTKNSFASKSGLCKKCSVCPPGHFVWGMCNSRRDTFCKACPKGSFATGYGRRQHCRTCTECEPGVQIVQKCSSNQDTLCGFCQKGYFRLTSTLECVECAKCERDIPGYAIEVRECKEYTGNGNNICIPLSKHPYLSALYEAGLQKSKTQERTTEVFLGFANYNKEQKDNIPLGNLTVFIFLCTGGICSIVLIVGILVIVILRRKYARIRQNHERAQIKFNRTKEYVQDCNTRMVSMPMNTISQSTPLLNSEDSQQTRKTSSCIEGYQARQNNDKVETEPLLSGTFNDDDTSFIFDSVSTANTKKVKDFKIRNEDVDEQKSTSINNWLSCSVGNCEMQPCQSDNTAEAGTSGFVSSGSQKDVLLETKLMDAINDKETCFDSERSGKGEMKNKILPLSFLAMLKAAQFYWSTEMDMSRLKKISPIQDALARRDFNGICSFQYEFGLTFVFELKLEYGNGHEETHELHIDVVYLLEEMIDDFLQRTNQKTEKESRLTLFLKFVKYCLKSCKNGKNKELFAHFAMSARKRNCFLAIPYTNNSI